MAAPLVPALGVTCLGCAQDNHAGAAFRPSSCCTVSIFGSLVQARETQEVWGGAGQLGQGRVLREEEGMFPYTLAPTEAVPALPSEEDIEWIQQLAELHKLEVVPLVQTFGHVEVGARSAWGGGVRGWMGTPSGGDTPRFGAATAQSGMGLCPESPAPVLGMEPWFWSLLNPMVVFLPTQFILKHTKYQHLREVERFPNSFNPHVPDTLALLKVMLSQVMEKHRHSSWIHIGADEVGRGFYGTQTLPGARRAEHPQPQMQVFHLGEGKDSRNWMSRNKGDTGTIYLNHIKEVLDFISTQYRGLRVLMWDDMLRKISVGALQGEGLGMGTWHCLGTVVGAREAPGAQCSHHCSCPTESGIAKHVSPVVWFYAPDFDAEQIGKVPCQDPRAAQQEGTVLGLVVLPL